MAKKRKKKSSWANRKLELAIYITGGLLAFSLVVGGIVFFQNLGKRPDITASNTGASSAAASPVSGEVSNVPAGSGTASSKSTPSGAALPTSGEPDQSKPSGSASKASSSSRTSSVTTSASELKKDLGNWNLLLVNLDNTIGKDFAPPSTKSIGNDQTIDSRVYSAYQAMKNAAAKDGVNIWPVSGYRSYEKQTRLYNNRVQRSKNENPSFSQKQAEDDAAKYVAIPGTSEHQTGMCIDFNSVEVSFANTKAGKWLYDHAADYGFTLRFPKDKTSITKISYEPWHYRYVGISHAKKMKELDYCLEEYLDYLRKA